MMQRTQAYLMTAVVLAFAAASFFIYPQADDFHYSIKFFEHGYWHAQVHEYFNWNARYIATALLTMSPLVWGKLWQYQLMPIMLLLGIFLSASFMVKRVLLTKNHEHYFFGLALTFLTLTGLHSVSEGLYWLASSYTYTISLIFLNLALAYVWASEKRGLDYVWAALFSALLIGCNETIMVLYLYLLGVTGLVSLIQTKTIPRGLIILGIISFLLALFVVLAPGNSVRASQFPKSHSLMRTLGNSFIYSFIDPFKFLTLSLIAFTLLNWEKLKSIIPSRALSVKKSHLILIMMGLFFISFAPSLWGMGRRPNPRTMNIIFYVYLLAFFPLLMVLVKDLPQKILNQRRYLILGLILSLNLFVLLKDYSGSIYRYGDKWRNYIASQGEDAPDERADVPRSIHFKFEDESPIVFQQYLDRRADFYR